MDSDNGDKSWTRPGVMDAGWDMPKCGGNIPGGGNQDSGELLRVGGYGLCNDPAEPELKKKINSTWE